MFTSAQIALLRAANSKMLLAGIDTEAGDLASSSARANSFSLTSQSSTGIFYDKKNNRVCVTRDGAVLSGYDFNGVTLYVTAKNVTVQNSTFEAGPNQFYCLQSQGTVTVKNCTFTGGSLDNPLPLVAFAQGSGLNLQSSRFLNSPGDAVDINSGTIQNCYFSGGGYSSTGLHPDLIWVSGVKGSVTITGNFVDATSGGSTVSTGAINSALRITTDQGPVTNVTVTNNVFLGGTYTIHPGDFTGTMSNVNISNNAIGFGQYGAFYYSAVPGLTMSNNTIFDFTNPIYSTNAWNAYVKAGVGTSRLLTSANSANVTAPTSGSSTLYGAGASVTLYGSATGETVFVGGAGNQTLWGGFGANIFKYLAFSDSTVTRPDAIGKFDAAKDVIDLSAIDANPAGASQNFKFIGGGDFSAAGGEVRIYQDTAANMTYVEATMAGDSTADLRVRIGGLVNLTEQNFALTASQSSAALAGGAAMKVTRTPGSGGVNAYTYANVLGHSYGSYQSIYNNAGVMVAQSMNLSNGGGSVNLMGDGLIYSDGAAGESLKLGSATYSLGSHKTGSLTLGGANETLQLHSGFGSLSVSGFDFNDRLQLDKSMFSYLNSGMNQAQDLAAVLSHSVSSASGLRIDDTRGDSLTLLGLTAAQVSSHASMITFV